MKNKQTGAARYKNLIHCERRNICPICAEKLSEQDRRDMLYAISYSGYRAVMVTYTLQHNRSNSLEEVYGALKNAFKFFKSGRRWQEIKESLEIVGCIRTREFTYGENGWHPHIHELFIIPDTIEDFQINVLTATLKSLWKISIDQVGKNASWDHGLDIRIADDEIYEYVSKHGREPVTPHWTVEAEMTKTTVKVARDGGRNVWQLLNDYGEGDSQSGALFAEYGRETKGDHLIQWSAGLKDWLGLCGDESTDAEIAEMLSEQTESEYVSLTPEQFRVIVHADRLGEVLEIAGTGDLAFLWKYLYWLGVPKVDHVDLKKIMDSPPVRSG